PNPAATETNTAITRTSSKLRNVRRNPAAKDGRVRGCFIIRIRYDNGRWPGRQTDRGDTAGEADGSGGPSSQPAPAPAPPFHMQHAAPAGQGRSIREIMLYTRQFEL